MSKVTINFYLEFNKLTKDQKHHIFDTVISVSENELLKRFKMEKIGQALSGERANVVSILGLMDISAGNPNFLMWLSNHLELCQLGDSWYYISELNIALLQAFNIAA